MGQNRTCSQEHRKNLGKARDEEPCTNSLNETEKTNTQTQEERESLRALVKFNLSAVQLSFIYAVHETTQTCIWQQSGTHLLVRVWQGNQRSTRSKGE